MNNNELQRLAERRSFIAGANWLSSQQEGIALGAMKLTEKMLDDNPMVILHTTDEKERKELLNAYLNNVGRMSLLVWESLQLKTHIETEMIQESSGDRFEFIFRKKSTTPVPAVSDSEISYLFSEIKRRHTLIISEPNGLVRDTMIADMLTIGLPEIPEFQSLPTHCQCTTEQRTGEISVMCCNHCGLPVEDFWKGEVGLPDAGEEKPSVKNTGKEFYSSDDILLIKTSISAMIFALTTIRSNVIKKPTILEELNRIKNTIDLLKPAFINLRGWISVKETLPKGKIYSKNVLIIYKDGNIDIDKYCPPDRCWYSKGGSSNPITHWQPLPNHY